MTPVDVTVTWTPEKLGRPAEQYSTLARFAFDPEFEQGAWSVTLHFDRQPSFENPCDATATFLNPDVAPQDWLRPGATFEMMEGRRVTAHVIVR